MVGLDLYGLSNLGNIFLEEDIQSTVDLSVIRSLNAISPPDFSDIPKLRMDPIILRRRYFAQIENSILRGFNKEELKNLDELLNSRITYSRILGRRIHFSNDSYVNHAWNEFFRNVDTSKDRIDLKETFKINKNYISIPKPQNLRMNLKDLNDILNLVIFKTHAQAKTNIYRFLGL